MFTMGSTPTECGWVRAWWRWLWRRCIDCGIKLDRSYDRGDVCEQCFANFNGMTLEELTGETQGEVLQEAN
jgi:hypothetical protein